MLKPISSAIKSCFGNTISFSSSPSKKSKPTADGAGSTNSVGAVEYKPERAHLGKMVYRMSHAHHGEATLVRHPKAVDSKAIKFEVGLRDSSGRATQFVKDMYITDEDANHSNFSTIGYGDIDFPEEMKNKGMSYLVHKALADAGVLLNIKKVAIDDVVSDVLSATCSKLGMSYGAGSSFNAEPAMLKKACDIALSRKGWQVEDP